MFLKPGEPRGFKVFILTIGKLKVKIKACLECPKQPIMKTPFKVSPRDKISVP
jgi:hypothetical protein